MSILKARNSRNDKIEKLKKELVQPEDTTPLNLLIDSNLHLQFKIKTVQNKVSMTEVVSFYIREYLKTNDSFHFPRK